MPRKSKTAILDAQRTREMTVEDWVEHWSGADIDKIDSEEQQLLVAQAQLKKQEEALAEKRREFERKQKELEEQRRLAMASMKLGEPMDMSATGKQLISANIPRPTYDKLQIVKKCYHDGLSGYIRYLIEQDLKENYDKYLMFFEHQQQTSASEMK